jgi:hypothetical protein
MAGAARPKLYAKVLHGQSFVAALRHDGNKHDPGKPQEIPPAGSTVPKINRITPRAQRGGDRAREGETAMLPGIGDSYPHMGLLVFLS